MDETSIAALESGIDKLLSHCETLVRENRALREERAVWMAERTKLVERNELAKNKIDAMISRLRSLDEPAPGERPGGEAPTDADR